jgi:hypothetical protein
MPQTATAQQVQELVEAFCDYCNLDENFAKQNQLFAKFKASINGGEDFDEVLEIIANRMTEDFRNDELDFDEQYQNNLDWLSDALDSAVEQVGLDE